MTLRELKERAVLDAIARHGGNKLAAAAELGVSLKTIYNVLARIRSRPAEGDAVEHEPIQAAAVSRDT